MGQTTEERYGSQKGQQKAYVPKEIMIGRGKA
jgi:hypothetical protein